MQTVYHGGINEKYLNIFMANFLQFLRESLQSSPLQEDFYDVRVGGNSYEKRDEIKKLGGKFDSTSKGWFVPITKAPLLKNLGLTAYYPVSGSNTFGLKDQIKQAGGVWDFGQKRWYAPETAADRLSRAGLTVHVHGGSDAEQRELKKLGAYADYVELKAPEGGQWEHKFFTNYFRAQMVKFFRMTQVDLKYLVPAAHAKKAQKALDDFIADNERIYSLGQTLRRGKPVTGTYYDVPFEGVIEDGEQMSDHGFFAGLKIGVRLSKPIIVYGSPRAAGDSVQVTITAQDLHNEKKSHSIQLA